MGTPLAKVSTKAFDPAMIVFDANDNPLLHLNHRHAFLHTRYEIQKQADLKAEEEQIILLSTGFRKYIPNKMM